MSIAMAMQIPSTNASRKREQMCPFAGIAEGCKVFVTYKYS